MRIVCLGLLSVFAMVGCRESKPVPEHPSNGGPLPLFASVRLAPREQEAGRQLYLYYCVFCHGRTADGSGINASRLPQPPTDFTSDEFRRKFSADRLRHAMRAGRPDSFCPPWGNRLSDRQIRFLAVYLRAVQPSHEP